MFNEEAAVYGIGNGSGLCRVEVQDVLNGGAGRELLGGGEGGGMITWHEETSTRSQCSACLNNEGRVALQILLTAVLMFVTWINAVRYM